MLVLCIALNRCSVPFLTGHSQAGAGLCACADGFLAWAGAPIRARQGDSVPVAHPWANNKPEQLRLVRRLPLELARRKAHPKAGY